jgi:hypothetical protein
MSKKQNILILGEDDLAYNVYSPSPHLLSLLLAHKNLSPHLSRSSKVFGSTSLSLPM